MSRSENILSRNFQGCCLLFNYQGSSLSVVFLATAILDYHIFHRLSTTFFHFFVFFLSSYFFTFPENPIAYLRRLLIISSFILNVNPIFNFFRHISWQHVIVQNYQIKLLNSVLDFSSIALRKIRLIEYYITDFHAALSEKNTNPDDSGKHIEFIIILLHHQE